jgi:hypothetical protein
MSTVKTMKTRSGGHAKSAGETSANLNIRAQSSSKRGQAGSGAVNGDFNWVANFIWGIADDVLRDLYVRGKYRDVILPMTVLRRLDAVLEPTKKAVIDTKAHLDKAKITNQDAALRAAVGQDTSKFTLRDLRNRGSQQQLKADFEAYLDGFSPNVQEILENFEFRNQTPRLSKADALGTDPVHLKNMLRQVQSDRGNLAHGWLPFAAVSIRQQFGTQMLQGGHPPHHSRRGADTGGGRAARRGMFAAYAAWSALEIELQALATLATLAQISTPSAAHFLKSHQLLVQKFAADRDRQRSSFETGAEGASNDFCNKICHFPTWVVSQFEFGDTAPTCGPFRRMRG